MKGTLVFGLLALIVGPFISVSKAAVTLESSLSVSEIYTDNLFFTQNNKDDDFGTFISPRVSLNYISPDIRLRGTYGGSLQLFVNNPGANTYVQNSNFEIDLPFLTKRYRNLDVQITETFNLTPQLQPYSLSQKEVQTGELGGETATGGGAVGGAGTTRGQDQLGFGSGLANQGVITRRTRGNGFQNLAGLQLRYNWTSRFYNSLGYQNRLSLFDNKDFQDSITHTVNSGLGYQVTPRTQVNGLYSVSKVKFLGTSSAGTEGEGDQGVENFITHFVSVGASTQWSPTFNSNFNGGVSFTEGRINLNTNNSLTKVFGRGDSLTLAFTQNVGTGGGVGNDSTLSQNLIGFGTMNFTGSTSGFIRGGISKNTSLSGDDVDISTYQITTGMHTQFLWWLYGTISYTHSRQKAEGNTSGSEESFFSRGTTQSNLLTITLTAAAPDWGLLN